MRIRKVKSEWRHERLLLACKHVFGDAFAQMVHTR